MYPYLRGSPWGSEKHDMYLYDLSYSCKISNLLLRDYFAWIQNSFFIRHRTIDAGSRFPLMSGWANNASRMHVYQMSNSRLSAVMRHEKKYLIKQHGVDENCKICRERIWREGKWGGIILVTRNDVWYPLVISKRQLGNGEEKKTIVR